MFKKIKLVVFDLDGVLVDSLKNMELSWNYVNKKYKLKKNFKLYQKHIGLPFYEILYNLNVKKNYKNIFYDYNKKSSDLLSKIKFYPNTKKKLKKIKKKFLISIFTSKNISRTNLLLKKLNIKFDAVVTPESVKKGKPDPEGLKLLIKKFSLESYNVLFLGDTLNDEKAAKKAGVRYIHAAWGYGTCSKKTIKAKTIFDFEKILQN